ncbi:MAG: HAMP domain-containing sensor histidine kinase [Lachnospiraceae bacterium]|nr:HAMP domain-containing sensor histidine kinase [Lachnospiraceae bacterium]
MKKSLGKKICAIGVAVIASFVIINIILTYFFMIPFSVYLSTKQMEKIAQTMEHEDSYTDEEFTDYIEQIDEDMNTAVTIIDGDKNVISTTKISEYHQKAVGSMSSILFDSTKEQLDNGEVVSMSRNSEKQTGVILVRVIKKVAKNRYVILGRSYRSLENAMYSAIVFDLLAGVVIILVGWLFVWRITKRMVIPIRNMQCAAEHISNLEFDIRVEVKSEDELGQLGMAINKMSDHLEANVVQLQNDLEKRKRLVRNISHEIKSPIAVIMGYADRLKVVLQKNPEKALQYCEIISNESTRVDVLVREMLELSKFEQKTEEMHQESFAVKYLMKNIRNCFQDETLGKNITYTEQYNAEDVISADFLLLERALNNLVRNAVAHGTGDQMQIRVAGKRNEEYYEFRVYNSGSHIDESEMESIWDAFSKVDKARTRGKGFGVGLSIVQEIVSAHDGYCGVENVEDGVEFMIAVRG